MLLLMYTWLMKFHCILYYNTLLNRVISIVLCTQSSRSRLKCSFVVDAPWGYVTFKRRCSVQLVVLSRLTMAIGCSRVVPPRLIHLLVEEHDNLPSYNLLQSTVTCIGKEDLPSPAGHTPICLQTPSGLILYFGINLR